MENLAAICVSPHAVSQSQRTPKREAHSDSAAPQVECCFYSILRRNEAGPLVDEGACELTALYLKQPAPLIG